MMRIVPSARPYEYQWVTLDAGDKVYSSNGVNSKRETLKLYSIPAAKLPAGHHAMGSFACVDTLPPDAALLVLAERQPGILVQPTSYKLIWTSKGTDSKKPGSIWKPKPPDGYVALGHVASDSESTAPPTSAIRCVRSDLVGNTLMSWVWNDGKSGAKYEGTVWAVLSDCAYPSGCFVSGRGNWGPNDNMWSGDTGIEECYQLYVQRYKEPR
jgi:hypothetical protein